MSVLVVAEHNNQTLNPATLNTVTAAAKLGGDITVLVAGHNCQAVTDEAAKVTGVSKVIHADDAAYAAAGPGDQGVATIQAKRVHVVSFAAEMDEIIDVDKNSV